MCCSVTVLETRAAKKTYNLESSSKRERQGIAFKVALQRPICHPGTDHGGVRAKIGGDAIEREDVGVIQSPPHSDLAVESL